MELILLPGCIFPTSGMFNAKKRSSPPILLFNPPPFLSTTPQYDHTGNKPATESYRTTVSLPDPFIKSKSGDLKELTAFIHPVERLIRK